MVIKQVVFGGEVRMGLHVFASRFFISNFLVMLIIFNFSALFLLIFIHSDIKRREINFYELLKLRLQFYKIEA